MCSYFIVSSCMLSILSLIHSFDSFPEFNATNWQFSYRFSDHYPSSNPYINADRIYELNQALLNTTSDKTWLNYIFSRAVNYQPGTYSRFQLYCAMRYMFDEGYKKCISEYNVPGG